MDPHADKVSDANRLYDKGKYDDAMAKYTEVLIHQPNSPRLHFNIGNAAYKKGDYEEALKSYAKTASLANDEILGSKAYYNLGNCKYRQGKLKENTNLGETIALYREALDYYKQSLDKNPEDTSAKYNHEFVERKIKELLDKQQQQQQQDQQEQQEQSESQQGHQQEQEGQSEENQESEGENAEQNQAQMQQAEAQESQENDSQEPEQKEGLTAQEARMLLDSLQDEELSQLRKRQEPGTLPRVLKDW
jgi:Ca-activated chloride channel family protein